MVALLGNGSRVCNANGALALLGKSSRVLDANVGTRPAEDKSVRNFERTFYQC